MLGQVRGAARDVLADPAHAVVGAAVARVAMAVEHSEQGDLGVVAEWPTGEGGVLVQGVGADKVKCTRRSVNAKDIFILARRWG